MGHEEVARLAGWLDVISGITMHMLWFPSDEDHVFGEFLDAQLARHGIRKRPHVA